VRVERVEDHRVEAERYEIGGAAAAAISGAIAAGHRIIAVGTTTTRTLEAVASAHDGAIVAGTGETDLFIYPGFRFRVVTGLLTNFHLPQSSLLMLVSAFAGRESSGARMMRRLPTLPLLQLRRRDADTVKRSCDWGHGD
jgi:S-adenosylmethionine:tRNA ribosyltransferase-isomerase